MAWPTQGAAWRPKTKGQHANPSRSRGGDKMTRPIIEVKGLTKTFGGTRAVDDLTLTIEPGMVTGFLGPNGAANPPPCG